MLLDMLVCLTKSGLENYLEREMMFFYMQYQEF